MQEVRELNKVSYVELKEWKEKAEMGDLVLEQW